ncbi:sugar ABC transporter ATP-binding protein [bacterium]|nr:MAG: sugar ABC transporter ATP-binding protein [bacterium]
MRGISKSFPGVRALDGVSLAIGAGEVHALVGENGAGKSTLMKILAGAQPADAGEIAIDGKAVQIAGPRDAERHGIAMIYQEFNLVPQLDVAANVMLGREPVRFGGWLDDRAARTQAAGALAQLGLELPLAAPVGRLAVAHQQMVEIAKALARKVRVLVMDEPTAALTDREIDHLFEAIRALRERGVAIVYISHRLEELPRIADRITVLRDGRVVGGGTVAELPAHEMIRLMVGREIDQYYPPLPPLDPAAPVVLAVRDLRSGSAVHGVSFEAHAGEILGLAGLVGAGRTEIVRAIAAADVPSGGVISIDGKPLRARGPHDAIATGIALVTEDRKGQGLVLDMSIRENVTLPHLELFSRRAGFIDRAAEAKSTRALVQELRIRTPSIEQRARNLSGGNQQKVVLAKWLTERARLFLFDEPTRGIDVGAKAEIYDLMVELAKAGAAVVMVSSELPEVLGMSHRVAVVRDGTIAAILTREEATRERVMALATTARGAA